MGMMKVTKPLNLSINSSDVNDIRSIYMAYYIQKRDPPFGEPQRWFNVIVDFLQRKGWDVCRPELLSLEDRILKEELTEKYVKVLMDSFAHHDAISEHEKLFLLITMGSDLRRATAVETLGILEAK